MYISLSLSDFLLSTTYISSPIQFSIYLTIILGVHQPGGNEERQAHLAELLESMVSLKLGFVAQRTVGSCIRPELHK
jgi:hypothetical protein